MQLVVPVVVGRVPNTTEYSTVHSNNKVDAYFLSFLSGAAMYSTVQYSTKLPKGFVGQSVALGSPE